jgi:hypothetical protein
MQIARRQGYGLENLINKIEMAYKGTYKPKGFSEKEKDLGLLILKIGGYKLAKIVSQSKKLPSTDWLYECFKEKNEIEYSKKKSIKEIVSSNIQLFFLNEKSVFSIKMDEKALKPGVRY